MRDQERLPPDVEVDPEAGVVRVPLRYGPTIELRTLDDLPVRWTLTPDGDVVDGPAPLQASLQEE